MKKFREENPLLFYGGILIIGILIYGQLAGNQKQFNGIESQPLEETYQEVEPEPIEAPQTEKEPTEEELRISQEEVQKNREEALAQQNDPNRNTFLERRMDLAMVKAKANPYSNTPNKLRYSYIFRDNAPYGRMVTIEYDDFHKKYHINFINEAGNEVPITLVEDNFNYYGVKETKWSFKYKGAVYKIE